VTKVSPESQSQCGQPGEKLKLKRIMAQIHGTVILKQQMQLLTANVTFLPTDLPRQLEHFP